MKKWRASFISEAYRQLSSASNGISKCVARGTEASEVKIDELQFQSLDEIEYDRRFLTNTR